MHNTPVLSESTTATPAETATGHNASARAGYLPLALDHVVLEGLAEIPVLLRTIQGTGAEARYKFTLYSTPSVRFTEHHRTRLKESGVRFIYIPLHEQMRFRKQVETHLEQAMTDPALAMAARSELVYETSVELVEELLAEHGLAANMPRLENVAKAVTTLVMNDAESFSHL